LREADVVIAAAGVPQFIKGEWLKPGAVVIDVGTNRVDAPDARHGYRLVGDVDFDSAVEVAGAITRVPGGVGPMTITMLLANTLKSAKRLAVQQESA
jgi:5,10-methylene-tetrahydrofolate dehydrogenase/methenyl tetrahydrofolate cyclohydrolase